MSNHLLNIERIQQILPQRPPYLMVDRAQILESGRSGVAIKNISVGEAHFCGHFPNHPILPGVLQVEAMNQLATLILCDMQPAHTGYPFIFAAERIKFRKPVIPGDRLLIKAAISESENGRFLVDATTEVDGQVTSQALLTIGFLDAQLDLQPRELAPDPKVFFEGEGLSTVGIMAAIPHRFPYLLIDRIVATQPTDDGGGRFVALKNITYNEPFFRASTFQHPFLPSYLVPEIAAQAGCAALLSRPEHQGKIGYFMSIDKGSFHRPILPGDQLLIDSVLTLKRERFGQAISKLYVGSELVAETDIKVTIMPQD